jgi:uncharacterized protein YcgI (DUF1989 family)
MKARPARRLGHDLEPEFAVGIKDIPANINLCMNFPVDLKGGMAIVDDISKPGEDLILVTSNYPQEHTPAPAAVLLRSG